MRFDTVIFDLDGTLIDSLAGIHEALNSALAGFGLPAIPLDAARDAVGHGVMNALRTAVNASFAVAKRGDAAAWFVSHADELAGAYRAAYASCYRRSTVLYPDVGAVLAQLRAQSLRCLAVSNKPERFCVQILSELGIAGYFARIVGEDTFAERKPSLIVWHALEKEFSLQRERTLMVGDGIADSEFGRNAGIAVCLVRYGITRPVTVDTFAGDYRIDSITELLPIVVGG